MAIAVLLFMIGNAIAVLLFMKGDRGLVVFENAIAVLFFVVNEGRSRSAYFDGKKCDHCFVICEGRSLFCCC
jgi:hypothetical protein